MVSFAGGALFPMLSCRESHLMQSIIPLAIRPSSFVYARSPCNCAIAAQVSTSSSPFCQLGHAFCVVRHHLVCLHLVLPLQVRLEPTRLQITCVSAVELIGQALAHRKQVTTIVLARSSPCSLQRLLQPRRRFGATNGFRRSPSCILNAGRRTLPRMLP